MLYNEYDEELLMDYISCKKLLHKKSKIVSAELNERDLLDGIKYVIRVHYTRYYGTVLVESFFDIDLEELKIFIRNRKIKNITS